VSDAVLTLAPDRLIAVCRADPTGRYDWIPPLRDSDLTIALDGIAHRALAAHRPLLFDELESWDDRSAAEHRITELLVGIREHPAVAAIGCGGHPLIDFVELRLREELARLLRGWTLACAGRGARELICDPGAPPALAMGLRAGLDQDPSSVSYEMPPALPGSRVMRAVARPMMQILSAGSKPDRVRIATVVAGKLSLALASLPAGELRETGIGVMPFPGLDHGNGALLALRQRLPLLATYGPRRAGPGPAARMPTRLGLAETEALDRAITLLVGRLLAGAASEFAQAVTALAGLERIRLLRALLLPSAAYGSSRLLIDWAHKRGLRVGAMQHGIYTFQEFDGADSSADVVFGWGERTVDQTLCWPEPRPRVLVVGLPGVIARSIAATGQRPVIKLKRVLIATTNMAEAPISPATSCEAFIDIIAPGLARLAAAGVELTLRPHPNEDPAHYQPLLDEHALNVRIATRGAFSASASDADLLISSTSSVAFEAAALGLPVLLWLGGAPQWVREKHLVRPWTEHAPGMFDEAGEFDKLVDELLLRPEATLALAQRLGQRLARFAQPFRSDRFIAGLAELAT